MGSFRPSAANEHLYSYFDFAGSVVETVGKSLRHSCRSELTRQGISLKCSPCRHEAWTISSTHFSSELAGVWPLRIPGTETAIAVRVSSSASPQPPMCKKSSGQRFPAQRSHV